MDSNSLIGSNDDRPIGFGEIPGLKVETWGAELSLLTGNAKINAIR